MSWAVGEQPLCITVKPGTTYMYSNFGVFLLGRVVHALYPDAESYEQAVQKLVWQPLLGPDWENRAFDGTTVYADRLTHGEPFYHPAQPTITSVRNEPIGFLKVINGVAVLVEPGEATIPLRARNYAENYTCSDSDGMWTVSASDLVRLLTSFDLPDFHGQPNPIGMTASTAKMMMYQQSTPARADLGYLWGFRNQDHSTKVFSGHNGQYLGTAAICERREDGLSFALIFNGDIPTAFDENGDLYDGGKQGLSAQQHSNAIFAALDAMPGVWTSLPDLWSLVGLGSLV